MSKRGRIYRIYIIIFSQWIKPELLQISTKIWILLIPFGGSVIPFGALRVCMWWGKAEASPRFWYKHLTIIFYSRRGPGPEEMAQRYLLSFSCSAKSLISFFQKIIEDFVAKVTPFVRNQTSSRVITFPYYSPEGKKNKHLQCLYLFQSLRWSVREITYTLRNWVSGSLKTRRILMSHDISSRQVDFSNL